MAETKNTKAFYKAKIPSDWELKELTSLGKVSSGGTPDTSNEIYWNGNINWCTPTDITKLNGSKYIGETVVKITDKGLKSSSATLLPKGSVIVCTRATIGKAAISIEEISTNQGFKNIIPDFKKVDIEFLYYSIINSEYKLLRLGNGSTFLEVSKSDFESFKIPLPPLPEQKAIASVLSTWDDAIHITEQLITQKEQRKKWLMQQLLTGKKRLEGFGTENYKKTGLDEVLIPVRIPLLPEADHLYRQIGIRSHGKGIFYKEKVTGKELGEKRVFWIQAGCFILNIVFAWEQAVAITTEAEVGMIASHRFPMYKPAEGKLNLEYILYFFKSPRGKQLLENASPGGAGRNKTLGQTEFLSQTVSLPTINEQSAIAMVLQAADNEINLLKAKADKLREQKKGLMQQLLTGKKRLKIK